MFRENLEKSVNWMPPGILFVYLCYLKTLQKLKIYSIKLGNEWQRIGKGVEETESCRVLFRIPFQHFSGGTEEIQEHFSTFGVAVSIRTRRSRAQFRRASAHSVNTSCCPNPGIVIASPLRRKLAPRRSRAPHPDWQRFLRENTAARSLLCQRLPYAPSNNSTTARHWLAGWLAGWLTGWLAGWLAGWYILVLRRQAESAADLFSVWMANLLAARLFGLVDMLSIWQSACPDEELTE